MSNIGILLTIVAVTYVCAAPPPDKPDKPCMCSDEYNPVCATDGKTYANNACVDCETLKNPSLKKRHDGPCKSADTTDHTKDSKVVKRSISSCMCTKEKEPVCGSDGVTYDNDCLLKCAARNKTDLTKVHNGRCKGADTTDHPTVPVVTEPIYSCACPRNWQPVCGSDGITYHDCILKCEANTKPGLTKVHDGPCESDETTDHTKVSKVVKRSIFSCMCTKEKEPVCGSDGVTYDNDCLLKCAARNKTDLTKVDNGRCKGADTTDHPTVPVVTEPIYSCACPRNWQPVCGSDGITYHDCILKCEANTKPGLTKVHDGPCESDETTDHTKVSKVVKRSIPSCTCNKEKEPVCGSDGVTYDNNCNLKCAAKTRTGLTKVHEGLCKDSNTTDHPTVPVVTEPICSCARLRDWQRVCGSDGVTYRECILNCIAETKPGLTKVHDGPCGSVDTTDHPKVSKVVKRSIPSCTCNKEKEPVCGSDGVTYDNNCNLKCAAKTKSGLTKVHEGLCKDSNTTDHPKVPIVTEPISSCGCPNDKQPVCGSNGITYDNDCLLGCAAKTEPGLIKGRDGPCILNRQRP